MPVSRTPLFVRLPKRQAAALARLATATGRPKQHLVSELIGDRLEPAGVPFSMGRLDVTTMPDRRLDEILTLDEVAAWLNLPAAAVRARADAGDLPGRRFGNEWRFAKSAVLDFLADGEPRKRKRARR